MSEKIQVPMPQAGWNCELQGGKSYSISEYLKLIEPRYHAYKEQISRCVSGLIAYAAQQSAVHQEDQISMLKNMISGMECFWGLKERTARQYDQDFDRAVSEARQSGIAPELTDQAKQDILTGLEVYSQEMVMSDTEGMGPWIQENNQLAQQLRDEWEMGSAPEQQGVLTITMGGMR